MNSIRGIDNHERLDEELYQDFETNDARKVVCCWCNVFWHMLLSSTVSRSLQTYAEASCKRSKRCRKAGEDITAGKLCPTHDCMQHI